MLSQGWYGEISGEDYILESNFSVFLFQLLMFLVQVIFMNLLIAVMGEKLGTIMKDIRLDTEMARADLVIDAETHFLRHMIEVRQGSVRSWFREILSLNVVAMFLQGCVDPYIERHVEWRGWLRNFHSHNWGFFPAHLEWNSLAAIRKRYHAGELNPKWLFVLKPAVVKRHSSALQSGPQSGKDASNMELDELRAEIASLRSFILSKSKIQNVEWTANPLGRKGKATRRDSDL